MAPSYQAVAEKMVQAFMERNSELQALRQYLGGKELMASSQAFISNQPAGATSVGPHHGEQTDQVRALASVDSHGRRMPCYLRGSSLGMSTANYMRQVQAAIVIGVPVSF